jgi:hypothetical protein
MNHEPKRSQEHKRNHPVREATPDELLDGVNPPSDVVTHVDLHELVKKFNSRENAR